MAASTSSRTSADTGADLLTTRETVARETPAAAATVSRVGSRCPAARSARMAASLPRPGLKALSAPVGGRSPPTGDGASVPEGEPVDVHVVGRLAAGEGQVDVVDSGDPGGVGRHRAPGLPAAGAADREAADRRRGPAVQ